jgi:hypothetical protein
MEDGLIHYHIKVNSIFECLNYIIHNLMYYFCNDLYMDKFNFGIK